MHSSSWNGVIEAERNIFSLFLSKKGDQNDAEVAERFRIWLFISESLLL